MREGNEVNKSKKNDKNNKKGEMKKVRDILDNFWDWFLAENPVFATFIGDERYDDKLPDISKEHKKEEEKKLKEFGDEMEKALAENERDEVDKEVFLWCIRDMIEGIQQEIEEFWIDHMYGYHLLFFELVNFQRTDTPERIEKFISRIEKYPDFIEKYINNLREGLSKGRTQFGTSVQRCIKQLEDIMKKPAHELPIFEVLKHLDEKAKSKYEEKLNISVEKFLKPPLQKFLDFLKDYKPREKEGINSIPGGEENYLYLIKHHLTIKMSPDEIYKIGLDELSKIKDEIKQVGKLLGLKNEDAKEIIERVKSDKRNFFSSRDEILSAYQTKVEEIYRKLPDFFGFLPKSKVIVKPVEEYLEKDAVGAFYYRPSKDGSRPGVFYINTYAPHERPRYELTALSAHEAVPGHHLQIAIAQELDLHPFRRHIDWDAFTEGWGLYSERLADDMGLYTDPLQRLGMLIMQAWRAIRLIVDTGIHAFGWSREKAIKFFLENTGLENIEVTNEVDRYIIWPAQALSYMIGMKKILELREWTRKRLGNRFSFKIFHDTILSEGGIPLEILEKIFKKKIEKTIEG